MTSLSQSPLASICIPLFNKGQYIARTLEAVLGQTYPNLEVVISDNGSTDGSETIAQDFARRDSRVKYFRLMQTVSMNENWRYCFRLAEGEFINIHSADDHSLQADFLERMIAPLQQRPEVGFSVCEVRPALGYIPPGFSGDALVNCYRAIKAMCQELSNIPDRDARTVKLLQRASMDNMLGTPYAVVCRRSSLPFSHWKKTTLSWPESYADWDFLIRLFLNHRGEFVDGLIFNYHYDAGSPYWRTFVDNRTDLFDKMYLALLPFTVLTDPELADLRRYASPEMIQQIAQVYSQRLRVVMELSDDVSAFNSAQLVTRILPRISQLAEHLRRTPNDTGAIIRFRQLRNGLVRYWLSTEDEKAVNDYAGSYGQAHRLFIEGGVHRIPLEEYEQTLVRDATAKLSSLPSNADGSGPFLALMLLADVRQITGIRPDILAKWSPTNQ
jgi:glycosyltransferase involved in cell wall biosynthesis